MRPLVCGVRHRHAGLDIRDQVALSLDEQKQLLECMSDHPDMGGLVALSTCNRSEFYMVADDIFAARQAILEGLTQVKGVGANAIAPYVFTLVDEDAILHLMRVASGLDSLIIGEGQVLNQVKDAFQLARQANTLHPVLDRWFQQALTVGKRIRTETGIARKDVSVSRAAYDKVRQLKPDFFKQRITLIGGGKMATLLMGSLSKAMPEPSDREGVTIVNRSALRLQELTDTYRFNGTTWDDIQTVLAASDIVFVATGAPHILITPDMLDDGINRLIVDVSVPRNVDPAVADLPNITLLNTDSLKGEMPLSRQEADTLKQRAQEIIMEEYQVFHQWQLTLTAVPTITRLRDRMETIRQQHIAPLAKHSHGEVVDKVSRQLVNSLFHQPLAQLRQGDSQDAISHQVAVMDKLFDLSEPNHPKVI